jgi:hypothetical protein
MTGLFGIHYGEASARVSARGSWEEGSSTLLELSLALAWRGVESFPQPATHRSCGRSTCSTRPF